MVDTVGVVASHDPTAVLPAAPMHSESNDRIGTGILAIAENRRGASGVMSAECETAFK
jgi:hypothetical protein